MHRPTLTTHSALLVDALGTLVALDPPAPVLRREFSSRFGIEVSLGEAERALRAEIAYYRTHLQEGRDGPSLAALRRRCAAVLRSALPAGDRLAAVGADALTDALLASLQFRAFADAPAALGTARARGRRVIVVSNWDVSLTEVLARVGLEPLIDGVVTSAAVGARKPAPEIFATALALAGVAAQRAVHVGDTIEEDVAGAQAAGVRAVLLRRDGSPGPAGVTTIASLAEFIP
jgi:putative hydrolase of the HAD superfamily